MSKSEVALLRERLELEHRACMWALTALNLGTAQHRFITSRFRQMDVCCARLTTLVGEEEATTTLCEVFDGKPIHATNERALPSQEREMEQ